MVSMQIIFHQFIRYFFANAKRQMNYFNKS